MLRAHLFKPIRAASSRCDDSLVGIDFFLILSLAVFDANALASVAVKNDVVTLSAENEINTVFSEIVFDCKVQIVRFLRAEMANGAIHEFETCLNCFAADVLDLFFIAQAFDMLVRAKFEIYFVGVIDKRLCKLRSDELRKFSAHFIGK